MAPDSEARLKKLMDKLYRAPRPRISSLSRPGGGDVNASKGISTRAVAQRAQVGKALPCRPWDRGDLFRRLATFKAMTWFGKPKDINPVNCARRGWINVEMDVIVCEACGARLLFSTPPSWSLQQVEKAAKVFSLKLDNGHKLLCPWINNVCDESLASFPPSPPQALVEGFKERSHALMRLTTLPVISSLAFDFMKSPQLDRFLSAPVKPSITLKNGVRLIDDYTNTDQDVAIEGDSSHDYYQAMNIISLCGWETRLLPYSIDFKDQYGPSTKTTISFESLEEVPHEIQSIASCSSRSHNGVEGRKDIYPGECLCDQSSTVLECRFCGACVGLWFFKPIPRPLEFFKITIDGDRQSELSTGTTDLVQSVEVPVAKNFVRGDHTSNIQKPSGLHFSIAGGPPPTKQQFRPKVSFPIVSRHLRAELLNNSYLMYRQGTSGKEDQVCLQKEFNGHCYDGSQNGRSLKRKQCELESSNSELHVGGNLGDVGHCLEGLSRSEHTTEEIPTPCTDIVVGDDVPCHSDSPTTDARESNDSVPRLDLLSGSNTQVHAGENHVGGNGLEGQGLCDHNIEEIPTPCTHIDVKDAVPCESDSPITDAKESDDSVSRFDQSNVNVPPGEGRSENATDEILTPSTNAIAGNVTPCQSGSPITDARETNDSVSILHESNCHRTPENDHCHPLLPGLDESNCGCTHSDLSLTASPSVTFVNSTTSSKTHETSPCFQDVEQPSAGKQVSKEVSVSINLEENIDHLSGNLKPGPGTDFDPIKQHRPFCPWICEGNNLPGWKAVLSALNNLEDSASQPPERTAGDSSFLDEIDDPVVSVRKLFMSPSLKKFKSNP